MMAAGALAAWDDNHGATQINKIAYLVCLILAAGCAGRSARSVRGRQRYGWSALVFALSAWAVGKDSSQPLESAAFTAVAVGAFASLLLLSDLDRAPRRRLVLDGLIVATSLFVLSWVFILSKFIGYGGVPTTTLLHIAADVILTTTAILVWSRPLSRPSVSLLAAGITTIVLADIGGIYVDVGGHHTGGLVDLLRVAGLSLVAFAALLSVNERTVERSAMELQAGVRVWLPYLPLLLAGFTGIGYEFRHPEHRLLLVAEAILIAAVLARQFLVLFENKRLLAYVAREAFHDSLTGLANRANFLDKLESAVARRRRYTAPIVVMCLDLDDFKAVNDALGHAAGDELLIRVAGRLANTLGDTWTVARLGGDEFAALCVDSVDALAAANRVLEAFTMPIVVEGVSITARPSIGMTVAATRPDRSADDLLLNADLAMYAAKRDGGGCVRSFVPDVPAPWELQQITNQVLEQQDSASPAKFASPEANPGRTPDDGKATSGRSPHPSPAMRVALGVLTLGVVCFTLSTILRDHAGRIVLFDSVLYPALTIGAAAMVFARAIKVPAERWPCLLIAAGMASRAVGDVVYAAWVAEGQMPSMADPLYFAFYPLVYAGMVLLMRERLKRVPVAFRLDALICGLTLGAVAAAIAAGPIESALQGEPATVLVGLAYPVGDLLLLALTAGMLPMLGWRAELRWGLLVAGFMSYAVADTVYLFQTSAGTYREGTWVDACWPVAALLIAVAGWMPSSDVSPRPKPGLTSYVPAVLCAGIALCVAVLANQTRVAVALAALTLIAVTWRFAVTFRDVSATAEAHHQAMTDELTGLPNRRSLATSLTAVSVDEFLTLFRSRSGRALLVLDIDQFSEINTHAGRHVGDQLLARVAARLLHAVRPDDLVARTGGDEFAVLFADGMDVTTARARAGALLEVLRIPFELDPITVQVDASIAIALCPEHCDHCNELLNCAETTMRHAKGSAGKIVVYDAGRVRSEKDEDAYLVEELRSALSSSNELMCFYQPKIRADDGRVHSVEALLRWQHPRRGLLLPEEFLPAAERAGLMRQVANCVVNLALGQVRSWRDECVDMTVAVNLSVSNLLDLDLVDAIERLLKTHDVPPEALILEITEGTFAHDSFRSRKNVFALRRLGVRISLDDYGTGWSSMARLQDLSVDELKLDKVFVSRLAEDPGRLRSCVPPWRWRTASALTWSLKESRTRPLCGPFANTAATSRRASCTPLRYPPTSCCGGSPLTRPRFQHLKTSKCR